MAQTTQQVWADRIRRWRASGVTAKEFAAQEGVAASTLYWWSSKLGEWAAKTPPFVEVCVPANRAAGSVEVVVRDGELCIRVPPGVDADLLRTVLSTLKVP